MEKNRKTAEAGSFTIAALAAMTHLGRLTESDRATVLRAYGLALGPRLWRAQDGHGLPTLTGLVDERDRVQVYGSHVWQEAYRPGRTIVVYMLQGAGLAALSAALGGVGIAKVGTAELANVERRVRDLGASEYGAWTRCERSYRHAPGFGDFVPATGLQLAPQHPLSPIGLGFWGIEVRLPADMTESRFEAEVNARLLPLRLQSLAGSAFGRLLRTRVDADPAMLRRFYKCGGRFKAATELTLARPRADSTALATIAADIVIDHVLGLLPRRSGR